MNQAKRAMQGLLTLVLFLTASVASAQSLGADDQRLLERLVLAEAQGEGRLGMALVARSVLNRTSLVRSGAVTAGTYNARSRTLSSIVNARGQYEPVSSGSINRRRTNAQLAEARAAIALAQDTTALTRALRAEGLDQAAITRLLASTGFRARSAYNDPSQNYGRQTFRNHIFNGDRFSRRLNVPEAFARYYAVNSRGIVGELSGLSGGEVAPSGDAASGDAPAEGQGPSEPARVASGGGAAAAPRAPSTGGGGSSSPAASTNPEPAAAPAPAPSLTDQVNARGPMGLGARGEAVRDVQQRLGLEPTGLLGLGTQRAIEAWQGEHGLPRTGRVDSDTAKALEAHTQPALPEGAAAEQEGDDVAYEQGRSQGSILLTEVDGRRVAAVTADAFSVMRSAARRDGVELRVVGGFRSMREQTAIFSGSSDFFPDRPGFSPYQTGRSIALNTSSPRVAEWLAQNALSYGFFRASPKESWQFEFRR